MNAISVYVNTAKLVLQTTEATTAATAGPNTELSRQLLSLRQLLSCVVCNRLVNDPFVPQNGHCAHNVCRLCVRGQKLLHPDCSYCKDNRDFKTYNENKQMRCLMMCYKSLCEHLRCSAVFSHFAGHKVVQYNTSTVPTVMVPQMSLQELIVEGANYDDILNAFNSDLPKPMIVPLPKPMHMPALVTPLTSIAAATPLAPIQQTIKVASMQQTAPKASTPPTSVTAAISIPVSTYAPKLKVENTTHHHFKHHTSVTNPTASLSNTPRSQQDQQTPPNTAVTHSQLIQLNQLKNSGNITYFGPNTRGIVVPIVSSSGSTAVPLSIASARLQTLNRQLAQARALAVSSASATAVNTTVSTVNTTSSCIEPRTPLATFKTSMASSQTMKSTLTTYSSTPTSTAATSVTTSSQIRNPPPIKTVSNGSAMYSVLYTGIGNKITIKRKTDGDEDTTQKKNSTMSTPNTNLLRPVSKTQNKKRGCRCGNTTATPGKLTCCGQRCPCYVDSKSCIGCKCRGCRNPHRPDGNKVRPIIPELACYEIQMADDNGNVNELPIATSSNVLNTLSAADNNVSANLTTNLNLNSTTSSTATAAVASTSTTATLMPIRGLHHTVSNSCVTTSTIPPLTSTTLPTQTSSMTQASFGASLASSATVQTTAASTMSSNITAPGSIVQLDQIQRESLLIQNAEVVSVFTTGNNVGGSTSCSGQSSSQLPTLQRIKTMPQTIVSAHNSFVLPSSISSTTMSGTTTTTSLPQLILQSQQQQQQHQHQQTQHLLQQQQQHHQQQQQHHQHHQQQQLNHQSLTTQRISNNLNTATSSLPLQLQQQLKQNIITVHAIHTNPSTNTSPVTAPVLTPSSSPAPTSATISLPPLIANNPNHTNLEINETTTDVSRNTTFTNIIVSSSSSPCENITTTTSTSITSMPITVSLSHTQQPLNRKSLNSPNF
ncbi:E3 ubiquitin-protein ligase msl-2 [Lucilia cuprina]|uniref:E3 ubiquitin-protein ligase msl-2 n=1 Tax=Lucilia cuprina TaxID=7375 RepID=A0A0L0BZD7_LUCCU|nr:E3 ubiquitin-protein ligase msl-2 [Lucilia cuprina]